MSDALRVLGGSVTHHDGRYVGHCDCERFKYVSDESLSVVTAELERCARHERPHAPAPTTAPGEPMLVYE